MNAPLPPQSIESEQATLGAMLISAKAAVAGIALLTAGDFYTQGHRHVFSAIRDLVREGVPADIQTVAERLKSVDRLEGVGGASYLITLAESVPTAHHVDHYASVVRDKSELRQLIDISHWIASQALRADAKAQDVMGDAAARLTALLGRRGAASETLFDGAYRVMLRASRAEETPTLKIGVDGLDEMTGGIWPGEMIGVLAPTSCGKSILMEQQAMAAARKSDVGLNVLEMDAEGLAMREFVSRTGLEFRDVRRGGKEAFDGTFVPFSPDEVSLLSDVLQQIQAQAERIHVHSHHELQEMMSEWRRLQLQNKAEFFALDYLQLMRGDPRQNRDEQLGLITQTIKQFCRKEGVRVMVLAQPSGEYRRSKDGGPRTLGNEDAKYARQLAMDCDTFLTINPVGDEPDEDGCREVVINVSKSRNGPTGRRSMVLDGRSFRLRDKRVAQEDPRLF